MVKEIGTQARPEIEAAARPPDLPRADGQGAPALAPQRSDPRAPRPLAAFCPASSSARGCARSRARAAPASRRCAARRRRAPRSRSARPSRSCRAAGRRPPRARVPARPACGTGAGASSASLTTTPRKPSLLTQQAGDDRVREHRRRAGRVEPRVGRVRDHHELHAGGDRAAGTAPSRRASASTRGGRRSTAVAAPRPGKCFAVAAMPPDCRPPMNVGGEARRRRSGCRRTTGRRESRRARACRRPGARSTSIAGACGALRPPPSASRSVSTRRPAGRARPAECAGGAQVRRRIAPPSWSTKIRSGRPISQLVACSFAVVAANSARRPAVR